MNNNTELAGVERSSTGTDCCIKSDHYMPETFLAKTHRQTFNVDVHSNEFSSDMLLQFRGLKSVQRKQRAKCDTPLSDSWNPPLS